MPNKISSIIHMAIRELCKSFYSQGIEKVGIKDFGVMYNLKLIFSSITFLNSPWFAHTEQKQSTIPF